MGIMELLQSLVQYAVIMAILVALAVGGIFIGRSLRKKKDEKERANGTENTVK